MSEEKIKRNGEILIVDDEESVRNLLINILRKEGYSVHSAGNGVEALKVYKKDTFDLIISDIKMPEMDGIELLKNIKQQSPEEIIIMMTGYGSLDTAMIALKQGAYDYIMKPFSVDEIRVSVNNAMERYRLIRENVRLKETLELFEISKAISKTIDLKDLLQLILTSALNKVGATRGSLMILDEENKDLVIRASVGIEDEIVKDCRVKIGQGIAGRVAEDGKPILISDVSEHQLFNKLSHQFSDKSFISVPLIGAKKEDMVSIPLKADRMIIGVLNLNKPESSKPFTEGDLNFLSILASQAAISIENAHLFQNLEETYLSTMKTLALMLEGKSPFTQGHSERVTKYSVGIAKEMGLSSKEISTIEYGSTLHDVGKIGVNDAILNKKGKLTDEEFKTIRRHSAIGFEMLKPIKFLKKAIPIVRNHHERVDGGGYPDGLSGEDLSLPVRICMVADAYDAMNSNRPYRDALHRDVIFSELDKNAGTQFDKDVTAVLIKMEESELKLKKTAPNNLPSN